MLKNDLHSELKSYLGYGHTEFIDYQLNPDLYDSKLEYKINKVNQSLDQAQPYNSSIVYHCGEYGNIPVRILSLWYKKRISKFVQMPTFLSTTRDANVFFKKQQRVFEIHTSPNSNGRDPSSLGFSVAPEGEITFKSGTFFEVIGATPKLIILKELMFIPKRYETLYRDYFKSDRKVLTYFKAQEAKRLKIQNTWWEE